MEDKMGEKTVQVGRVVITANALERLNPEDVLRGLCRHAAGDWGDCCTQDWQDNDEALQSGWRLFSVYRDANAVKFWVITEADRSVTTVLLPEDY